MATVLVTGASGFIALHCIDQLLKAGHTVRGTLRTMSRADEVRSAVGEADEMQLSFHFADLTGDEGWAEAVAGCEYVLHVASPFPPHIPENEDELIIPARDGALRALKASLAAGVKRVVLTSSMAAITGGIVKTAGEKYIEADWTDVSHASVGPYEKSKTIAERAAWDFVAEHPELELAVINPGAVLGPQLAPDSSSSGDVVKLLLEGAVPVCPPLGFGCVDVRDVAAAHIAAMTAPGAAGNRFICCRDHVWMKEIADILARNYKPLGYKVPTRSIPVWLAKFGANFNPTLKRVKHMLGRRMPVDNRPLRDVLGINLRSMEEMTLSMAASMIALGVVEAPDGDTASD